MNEKEEPIAICVDLGGTNTRVALINDKGKIVKECHRRTEADKFFT